MAAWTVAGCIAIPTDAFDVDVAQEPVRRFPERVQEHAGGVAAIRGFYKSRHVSVAVRVLRRVRRGVLAAGRRRPA